MGMQGGEMAEAGYKTIPGGISSQYIVQISQRCVQIFLIPGDQIHLDQQDSLVGSVGIGSPDKIRFAATHHR